MFKKFLVAMISTTLIGCGGSSDNSTTTNTSNANGSTSNSVTSASKTVVSQLGLTTILGSSSTAQAFDLTADIGDTWRLALNQNGTYSITILQSQYGLASSSGSYTQNINGHLITLAGANNSFALTLDSRTQTINGTVILGNKTSSVTGTGYATPSDLTKLAGDYFYIGATHNAVNSGSSSFIGGTFRIAANGSDVTLCNGLIDANGLCSSVSGSGTPTQTALKLVQNSIDGLTHLTQSGTDFGIVSVQAGDLGPVLVIDRYGSNQSHIMRTGVLYAAKQKILVGTELNGTWVCEDRGTTVGTLVAKGNALSAIPVGGTASNSETLHYNQINNTSLYDVNGVVTSVVNGDSVANGVLMLPLSSSVFVIERANTQSVAICSVRS